GPTPEAPDNDNFADRITLTGTNVTVFGSTVGATREADEPATAPWNPVWWSWTAPVGGICILEPKDAAPSPVLRVYLGASLSALTPVANLTTDPWRHYIFAITPGTTYQIAVGGEENSFRLSLLTGATPANDNFADRIILAGTNLSAFGSTLGATSEGGEPNGTPWNSVWWSWTAPFAGVCIINKTPDFETAIGVF